MRLNRLDLWRFGKFTDFSIDFGEHSADQPDLHIIYGPNEAGKSTLMAAYLELLFGFHPKTPYNFKHANTTLKIGAVLSIDGDSHEFRRLKKNKDSLIDGNEQPVSDSVLQQHLAGLGKESYATMFSLDDDTLEKGGESILASKGDLGKLLYSATTGVAQLSESLLQMRAETAEFYDKRKRKFELAELKNSLKEIDSERKQLDTEASGYAKLVREHTEADTKYEALGTSHDNLKLQIRKLQQRKNAYPRLSSLQRLQTELEPLAKLPEAPPGWIDEVRQLQIENVEITTREQDLLEKIKTLDDGLTSIALDEAALNAGTTWQKIETDRDSYLVACTNLPELKQQARLCEHEITNCLQKLDQPDIETPRSLILSASTQANIRELIQQQPGLVANQDAATKELSTATQQNLECRERFLMEGGVLDATTGDNGTITTDGTQTETGVSHSTAAIDELELEIAAYSNNELSVRRRTVEQQLLALQDELTTKLTTLAPWTGDGKALQTITIPHSSELQSLQQRRDTLNSQINEETLTLQALNKALKQHQTQQQSYTVTGLLDDTESGRLRRIRDEAWVLHRQTMDAETADNFERAMRADDSSQATRLQQSETVALMSQLSREIYITEDSINNAKVQLTALNAELTTLNSEVTQLISRLSPALNSTMSIEVLASWLEQRATALQILQKITTTERELENIDDQALNACATISKSLTSAGVQFDSPSDQTGQHDQLAYLLKTANTAVKRETLLSGVRDQLITSQHHLSTRRSALESASAAVEQWKTAWQQTCEGCWLGLDTSTPDLMPSTTVVGEMLLQLDALELQLARQSDLMEKISGYEATINTFSESLTALAVTLSINSENLSADQCFQTLQTRMDKAVDEKKSLADLQARKNEHLEVQKSNHEKRSINQQSTARMNAHFSVESIDDVELQLQAVKNKENLQQRFAGEQQELLTMLEVSSLPEVTDLLDGFDSDATQLELDELERTAKDTELQLQEAHTLREQARKALENVGGDEAVALLTEQRANLLLLIKEKATRYLQLHLALIAADTALKTYRDNHRSSMMQKASEAFANISDGRYLRLDTLQDGASEKLIAIDNEGQSKLSSQLSKGTRFQLYLALRVAGYHEYARTRPPVPFIADDIMETSDDDRSARTFEVLGEMAKVGQVIYLTHHQHLCEIAERVVPGCRVHGFTKDSV